ncbi:MAG: hypothetical protein K6G75_06365 [Lachnospiraceae bacterium]|nr:hypothetical protein [Lachnospiraceae bacterium]
MGLFKSGYEKEMDEIIKRLEMNKSNNYKDAAQANLKEFEELFEKYCKEGKLKDKVKAQYGSKLEEYRKDMKGYTHKDQKPFWT